MSDKMGGPAFPQPMTADQQGGFHHTDEHPDRIGGMRLYDYYAAAAMQGLLAEYGNIQTSNAAAFELAQAAEIYASAMLTVRNVRMNEQAIAERGPYT